MSNANVFIQSSGATVKAVTASQEYITSNETKSTLRGKPATRWKLHNNKQTREKSQVVMKGIQLPVVSNNATTGHKLQGS
jgi:hypothetical protein